MSTSVLVMPLSWRCRVRLRGSLMEDLPVIFVLLLLCFTWPSSAVQIPDAPVSGHVDSRVDSHDGEPDQVFRSIANDRRAHSSSTNIRSDVVPGTKPENRVRKNNVEETLASETANPNDVNATVDSVNSTYAHGTGSGQLSVDSILCEYYTPWSKWRPCNRKCEQSRVRRCQKPEHCGTTWLQENRTCQRKRGPCSTFSYKTVDFRQQNRLIERVLYDVLYTQWSAWGPCTRSCRQSRRRKCAVRDVCHNSFIQEMRRCTAPGTKCQRRYSFKPSDAFHEDDIAHVSPDHDNTNTLSGASGPESGRLSQTAGSKNKKKKSKETKPRSGGLESDNLDSIQATCGVRPRGKSGSYRVVGGQEARRLSWPWQAAILTRWEEQYCAGTLVAPQWLLTAAHCIRKKNRRRRLVVRTGEHDLQMFEGSEDDIRPDKDFPHPEFDYATITNDIALIHLRHSVKGRSQVRYACLPDSSDFEPDPGALCHILGWGKTRNTHLFGSETLHEAQVPIVNRKRCQKVFDYDINKTQVCAGYRKGRIDSCAGDSGGPLLCPKTRKGVTRWHLTGITSYGEGCGRRGKYGIYTRVASYLDWIRDTIESF